jgi:hypothetical protein
MTRLTLLNELHSEELVNGRMDSQQRDLADFLARLASVPSPSEDHSLKGTIRAAVVSRKRGFLAVRPHSISPDSSLGYDEWDTLPKRRRVALEVDFCRHVAIRHPALARDARTSRMFLFNTLPYLHDYVRCTLKDLFDGKAVVLSLNAVRMQLDGGRVRTSVVLLPTNSSPTVLRNDFHSLLQQRPFPFGRCSICRTVFVRVGRQKYCSPRCTYRGTESARKDDRREYMRAYMAERRRRQRRGAAKRSDSNEER